MHNERAANDLMLSALATQGTSEAIQDAYQQLSASAPLEREGGHG